ncbi:PH domain-containing protein [Nesterenkonia sp. LB17]|uniref:PH domain-containing protein n=1 Tax=unclassified Nesterenkonia TaxID=2629769 RepID=UPI001F4C7D10|nr:MULTISPECIES: PH domain-containing protein [unclassified Nesterenkonia]MCH8561022.1 PH domain-containing protein [Nesterenkonia sp. DZ6]MCH8563368.1 PH domain-containing protein [Nesterenkonia sp. YGD6]MCH8566587.1 PH domain-containing protein [Nesterenkonia sp. LB17]MCH8571098.1 PH domain-containing protein [Nesterenkonia sp. AY15]
MPAEPIDPTGVTWTRVDERYITVKFITGILGWVITLAVVGTPIVLDTLGVFGGIPLWIKIVVSAVLLTWAAVDLWLIPRRIRAIGYHERQDDLLIRRGILFQRVVAVPYGRLQYVDIEAGPLMRRYGLCTVQLKTAAAATDAVIPGASREEGARLREELSVRGQARLAGL